MMLLSGCFTVLQEKSKMAPQDNRNKKGKSVKYMNDFTNVWWMEKNKKY